MSKNVENDIPNIHFLKLRRCPIKYYNIVIILYKYYVIPETEEKGGGKGRGREKRDGKGRKGKGQRGMEGRIGENEEKGR